MRSEGRVLMVLSCVFEWICHVSGRRGLYFSRHFRCHTAIPLPPGHNSVTNEGEKARKHARKAHSRPILGLLRHAKPKV